MRIEHGIIREFDRYDEIVIPRDCIGISPDAYEDLAATADERKCIDVEFGNERLIVRKNCLIERESGRLILGCKSSDIPDDGSVKIIGSHAFRGIGGLESDDRDCFSSVTLPDGLEVIEHHAFADSGLKHIELPDSVRSIGAMAFMLTRLGIDGETVTIPESTEHIGAGMLAGCTELCRLRVSGRNKRYASESDCIFDVKEKRLVAVHCGKFGEMLPSCVESVEMLCFFGHRSKARYYFGEKIREIKKSPLDLPSFFEFPIIIVSPENSYAHNFAKENGIEYEKA